MVRRNYVFFFFLIGPQLQMKMFDKIFLRVDLKQTQIINRKHSICLCTILETFLLKLHICIIGYWFSFFGLLKKERIILKIVILELRAQYLVNRLLVRGKWSCLHVWTDLLFKHLLLAKENVTHLHDDFPDFMRTMRCMFWHTRLQTLFWC